MPSPDPFEGWLDRFDWVLIVFTLVFIPVFIFYDLDLFTYVMGIFFPTFLVRLLKPWLWRTSGMILNLGCGEESYGTVRADITRSKTTNVICDAHFLPFRDEAFSLVVSNNLFEHLGSPMLSLLEQKRVLQPKGQISLVTDNASYWRFHVPGKSAHICYEGRSEKDQHFMFFLPFHLRNFFKKAGFSNIQVAFVAEKPYRITGAINSLLRRLRRWRHLSYGRIRIQGRKPQ